MVHSTELPRPAVALFELGIALVRRAPSAQIAIARAGGILEPGALPPELREPLLREFEAARAATAVPLARKDVERTLKDAWGAAPAKVLDDFDPEPLAVRPASQVHRGAYDGVPVTVKVRRPGVERGVRADLALLEALPVPLRAAFPRLDAAAILRDLREQALDELDLEHEASQQRRLARALRDVDGVTVPRPLLDLCHADVLVADHVEGPTLADGGRPPDPGAAARALIAAFRTMVLDTGLAPADPRASHVVVRPDGALALLGAGVARPVERERAARALEGLAALADDDAAAFAAVAVATGVIGEAGAQTAHPLLRTVLGDLVDGPATLDAAALRAAAGRALDAAPDLLRVAGGAAPRPDDLVLGRMLGQLVAVLARLRATEDWVELAR